MCVCVWVMCACVCGARHLRVSPHRVRGDVRVVALAAVVEAEEGVEPAPHGSVGCVEKSLEKGEGG